MNGATSRRPLVSKNSGIPRPTTFTSKLPQPSKTAVRKRAASEIENSGDKENLPKRAKLDPSHKKPVSSRPNAPSSSTRASARPAPTRCTSTTTKKTTSSTASKTSLSSTVRGAKGGSTGGGRGKQSTAGAGGGGGGAGGSKAKRPAWDLKGRLQDMESLVAGERESSLQTMEKLQERMCGMAERLQDLEQVRSNQQGTIEQQHAEKSAASQKIELLQSQLEDAKQSLLESTRRYNHEIEILQLSKSALQRSHDQLEGELSAARAEVTALRTTVGQMAADASSIQCQLDATKAERDRANAESALRAGRISELETEVSTHLSTIARCEEKLQDDEMVRRKLHNTIQELKGNIRVFCRVRPFLKSESDGTDSLDTSTSSRRGGGDGGKQPQLEFDYPEDGKKLSLHYSTQELTSPRNYDFEFDRVFSPLSNQFDVFSEINQLVQSVLDGYNVCIFAYGQTGSGKTYTMEGLGKEGDQCRGMIPRAVDQVFTAAAALREKGWEYKMEASFIEIYNETLRDLLSSTASDRAPKLEVRINPSCAGDVYVTNLTPVTVTSQHQVAGLLERAAKNRAVAATQCNERSSRSHSVFRLQLAGKNEKTGEACQGTLNMIDLAGSERLSQSGSVGDRLRETKNINKSLSNLGQVIMALANKEQHVPYRNSKLTYLLQNSLGGNSKTLMFVNVSPLAMATQETLCSLRFATKVNQCNIGTATKKVLK